MTEKSNKNIKRQQMMPGGHGPGGFGLVQKPKNFKKTIIDLAKYMRPFWISLILVFVFAVASTVFAIVSPKILGNMTNQVVNDYVDIKLYDSMISNIPKNIPLPAGTTGTQIIQKMPAPIVAKIPADKIDKIKNLDLSKRPEINFGKLKKIAFTLLTLYILSSIFSYLQGWIMSGISQKVTYQLRKDISKKINRLPLSYFDKQTFGEVLSRVTNDVDTVSQTLNQSLTQILTSITLIIGILIMMFTISWHMTLVSLFLIPFSFLFIGGIIKKSQGYFKDQQNYLGQVNGHIEEMYAGHNIMRVFNGEKASIHKFNQINNRLYGSAWKSQFLSGLMFPIMNFIGNLGFVGVSVVGGWLAINGKLQIGDIQAFIQYVNQFNQPIVQTANTANVLQSTAASAERVFEFLSEKEEIIDAHESSQINSVRGEVEFKNVVFSYNPEKKIIKGFSAKIKPGQKVAIVGPTGAGKTTLVNLLMRFYDIDSGEILIEGINIQKMKRHDVRKLFGMVLQDTWLFNGTIKENISYSKPDATDAEIFASAKASHVDHFVHALPQGYNLELNEEADNLSAGEKQLLSICRAMIAKTPMLILDEATSSVDTRTEVLIQKAMDKLMKGKTSFVIAHRLSTIRDADLILVVNDGNIVEQGTHNELLKKNGFYASLYRSQFTSQNS